MSLMPEVLHLARRFHELNCDFGRKLWAKYTTGYDFGLAEVERKQREIYADKGAFALLTRALDSDLAADDRRRVDLLHQRFRPYHQSEKANALVKKIDDLTNRLSEVLNKNRCSVDGREMSTPEITRLLSESPDRNLRRRAYLSRSQINRKLVDAGFLELIATRKEYAQACEATDFVSFRLEHEDLAPDLFHGWAEQCSERSGAYQDIRRAIAQRYLNEEILAPWDGIYLQNQLCRRNREVVDLTGFRTVVNRAFCDFGFEMENADIVYDIFPRKNKSEWGYMFPIENGRDIRVLANMDNRFSSYGVLMHESGHAVHYLGLDPEDHLLNSGVSGIVAEGFANFFGDVCYSSEFLGQFFPNQVEEAVAEFQILKGFTDLANVTCFEQILFDHELYRQDLTSLADINELKWKTTHDLLGESPYADEPLWGHVIHHTTAPIYLHNYFLGDVMCEAMKRAFKKRTGDSWEKSPREFGRMWKDEVLAPSGRYPFGELFTRVTGEKPNIAGFLDASLASAQALTR